MLLLLLHSCLLALSCDLQQILLDDAEVGELLRHLAYQLTVDLLVARHGGVACAREHSSASISVGDGSTAASRLVDVGELLVGKLVLIDTCVRVIPRLMRVLNIAVDGLIFLLVLQDKLACGTWRGYVLLGSGDLPGQEELALLRLVTARLAKERVRMGRRLRSHRAPRHHLLELVPTISHLVRLRLVDLEL